MRNESYLGGIEEECVKRTPIIADYSGQFERLVAKILSLCGQYVVAADLPTHQVANESCERSDDSSFPT